MRGRGRSGMIQGDGNDMDARLDRARHTTRRRLLAAAATVAVVALAGCGGGTTPEEIVEESVEATSAVESFHFTLDVRNQPPSTTGLQLAAAEGDIDVPDRMKADVSGTFSGVPITTQLVVVGEDTYYKDPLSGAWESIDVNTSPIPFFDPAEGVLAVMESATELQEEGTETVGGVDTVVLTGKVTVAEVTPLLGNPPSDEVVEAAFWIGQDDSILRRVSVLGPISPDEPADVERIVEVSRFDEPVTIEPPKVEG